jgi:hypothetical protein
MVVHAQYRDRVLFVHAILSFGRLLFRRPLAL